MATPYMSLSLPTPGVTAGPGWASQLNAALTVLDGHNHTPGSGVQVPTAGINVNADLTFAGFNAINLRSSRFSDQPSALVLAADLRSLYASGGDLYYNNGSGTSIQLTAGSALNAASIGGIGGDYATSTASVFYTSASKAFSFWQGSNNWANIDVGSVIIREPGTTSPNGITLKSPTGLAAAFSLTLPAALPGSTLPLSVSATGATSVGQVTTPQIAAGAVTTACIAAANVTTPLLGADVGAWVAAGLYDSGGNLIASKGSVSMPAGPLRIATGTYVIPVAGLTANPIITAAIADTSNTWFAPSWTTSGVGTPNAFALKTIRFSGGAAVITDAPFVVVVHQL